MNLAGILEQAAANFPDSVALVEKNVEFSYADLNAGASAVATGLVESGLRPGDPVALCLPNSREWLAVYFGVIRAGGDRGHPVSRLARERIAPGPGGLPAQVPVHPMTGRRKPLTGSSFPVWK